MRYIFILKVNFVKEENNFLLGKAIIDSVHLFFELNIGRKFNYVNCWNGNHNWNCFK